MKPEDDRSEMKSEQALDRVFDQIREEAIEPDVVKKAAENAWQRISAAGSHGIHGCADFRAMMPDYREGKLSAARSLLLKDHLRECVSCRKEYSRAGEPAYVAQPARPASSTVWRWAIAAVLMLVLTGASWYAFEQFGPPPDGPAATVASLESPMFLVEDSNLVPLNEGTPISAGETVRVGAGSGALVRLRDGSVVELKERSDFTVFETRRDVTIRLTRGSVIVEAAKRSSGHLYVSTRDCRVAVTGTVFSVLSGVKGSRVSVIEGEVEVDDAGRHMVLHAGQQHSSNANVETVPVSDEISWSRNAAAHLALLGEVHELANRMDQEIRLPDLRYSSALLGGVPPETGVYLALPNLGETLSQARRILEQQIADSPALSEWWQQQSGEQIQEGVERMRRFASYFGNEISVVMSLDGEGEPSAPVFLTTLVQRGFPEFVSAELPEVDVRVFSNSSAFASDGGNEFLIYMQGDKVAVSPSADGLRQVAACLEGACAPFDGTPLGRRVRQAYGDGVGVLFAADLERIGAQAGEHLAVWGNVRDLIFVERLSNGQPDTRATVSFQGEREGISSWLANPAPIGALDFVSPEAVFVAAAAASDAVPALDELLQKVPELADAVGEAESELSLSVRNDFAATLGTEVAFAVDGALVPTPSWKFVAEVYDPEQLQWTIRQFVDSVNRLAAENGHNGPTLTSEAASNRVWYTLTVGSDGPVQEVHYVFVDGYLVAAPSRAILERAIDNRASGNTLVNSDSFRSLLPRDRHANFSAVFYHDFGTAMDAVRQVIGEEQQDALGSIGDLAEPALVVAYANDDEISLASTSKIFGFTPSGLLGLRVPSMVAGMFGHQRQQQELNPDRQ